MADEHRLSRRALLLGGMAGGAGLILAGCSGTSGRSAAGVTTGVGAAAGAGSLPPGSSGFFTSAAVIGDSITVASTDAINRVMGAAGVAQVSVDAEVSRRIAVGGGPGEPRSGKQALRSLLDAGADPQVWVIALGTNDIGAYREEEYEGVVGEMLDALPDRPLVWVDVYRRDKQGGAEAFNRVLRDAVATRDGVVGAWHRVCTDRGAEVLRADRIHPSDAGTDAFATVVMQALVQLSAQGAQRS